MNSVSSELVNIPFVEAKFVGGKHRPTSILLHSSFTTSRKGAALGLADAMFKSGANESFHYVVDEETVYRCVDPKRASAPALLTKGMLTIKLANDPSLPVITWRDENRQNLMHNSAKLVAKLCLVYGIRPRFLTREEYNKWYKWRTKRRGGIIPESFFYGPGFPEDQFMELVNTYICQLKAK